MVIVLYEMFFSLVHIFWQSLNSVLRSNNSSQVLGGLSGMQCEICDSVETEDLPCHFIILNEME